MAQSHGHYLVCEDLVKNTNQTSEEVARDLVRNIVLGILICLSALYPEQAKTVLTTAVDGTHWAYQTVVDKLSN